MIIKIKRGRIVFGCGELKYIVKVYFMDKGSIIYIVNWFLVYDGCMNSNIYYWKLFKILIFWDLKIIELIFGYILLVFSIFN